MSKNIFENQNNEFKEEFAMEKQLYALTYVYTHEPMDGATYVDTDLLKLKKELKQSFNEFLDEFDDNIDNAYLDESGLYALVQGFTEEEGPFCIIIQINKIYE